MNKLYKEEIKEKFLSTYTNEATQRTIRNVFYKTELVERVLEKDLMDFTQEEIGKAILNCNPHAVNVARSIGRFISQYITWCIEPPQRYRKNTLNPLQGVLPEWYDNFVDKSKKIHYSYNEFISLLEELHNGQDQAFLFLIWEGIIGEKFSEIQQLTFEDISFDNCTIFVKDRNEDVKVSEDCIKYLEKAYNQDTYYQYNPNTGEFNEKELLKSPYLMKNVKSPRGTENSPVGMSVLYNRIHAMKDFLGLDFLTPNAIKQSGMIKAAYDIVMNEGKTVLGYDELSKIGDHYLFSTITNNGYTYINTYLMKEFINSENLKELYSIDVEFAKK